jgi:steroid 5-alpha reductase family enzyme
MQKFKDYISTGISVIIVLSLAVLAFIFGRESLAPLQQSTLIILLSICGCSILYCFVVGELAKNFSQMDKLWSILPIIYTWVIAIKGGFKTRLLIYALIVTAWGIRLTVNFARKGAYSIRFWEGEEDYRWSIVHQSPFFKSKISWILFNLLFISTYQNILVLAICLPALASMESVAPFGVFDNLAVVLSVGFLLLETIADEQQWRFHQNKKSLLKDNKLEDLDAPYNLGFNTMGLWGYMRHPNYLGEQGIWLSLYIFAIGAGVARLGIFHWSMIGPLFLVLLFMGSSTLGESISSGKYPKYKDYTEQVFKYLPLGKFKAE